MVLIRRARVLIELCRIEIVIGKQCQLPILVLIELCRIEIAMMESM